MVNKKDRRHDGWCYPKGTISAPRQWILDNCLEPQPYWDDWMECRDGQRFGKKNKRKIKKQAIIRKARKAGRLFSIN